MRVRLATLALAAIAALLIIPALGIAVALYAEAPVVFAAVVVTCVALFVVPAQGQGHVTVKESFFDGF